MRAGVVARRKFSCGLSSLLPLVTYVTRDVVVGVPDQHPASPPSGNLPVVDR